MFTRGGVYRVVSEALGRKAAKFSVSAGLYLASLLDQLADQFGLPHLPLAAPLVAAVFAVVVIAYFWWANVVGIPFSSPRALRVMQITTVIVVILIAWCLLTIATKGYQPVPAPSPANMHFGNDALGWLHGTHIPDVTVILQAAGALQTGTVVVGVSEHGLDWQAREIRDDWQGLAERGGDVHVEIAPDGDGAGQGCDVLGKTRTRPRPTHQFS